MTPTTKGLKGFIRTPAPERFARQVVHGVGCWLWSGERDRRGYGVFYAPKRTKAHRYAYEQASGPIPDGLVICHRCDTPACVRPDHLFAATQSENMKDCSRKGRLGGPVHPAAQCVAGHPKTPENVWARPGKGRKCKLCHIINQRIRRARATEALAADDALRGGG